MKFFYDHNISWRIAQAIQLLVENQHRHEVRAKRDLFRRVREKKKVPDTEWLGRLGKQGDWIAITNDTDILELAEEREAWQRAKMPLFYVPLAVEKKEFGFWNRIVWHVRVFPQIAAFAEKADRSKAYRIPLSPNGNFREIPLPAIRHPRTAVRRSPPVARSSRASNEPLFERSSEASAG